MINSLLYNLSIHCLSWVYQLASVFNPKAKKWLDGREITEEVLDEISVFRSIHPQIDFAWFHCASLGEFEQGRPVIEAFKKDYPEVKIVLSFFSPSGYEVRKNYAQADYIVYLPTDTPENARKFVGIIQPRIAFFVKYEFWSNFLKELKAAGAKTVGFSVILRPGQMFFKPYGGFFRSILFRFDHIFVQNKESGDLLQSIAYDRYTLAGDTRFDRVAEIAGSVREISVAQRFKAGRQTMVIGSAWAEDMKVLIPLMNNHPELSFIVAPHEISGQEIIAWQSEIKSATVKYSEIQPDTDISQAQVLFIDNVGMLSSLYQYADFAYIGGAFGKGLHNTLEAAVFGVPLFFGNKNYTKFREALDLIEGGSAFAVGDTRELENLMTGFQKDPKIYSEACKSSSSYIKDHVGATAKIMQYIRQAL